MARRYTMTVEDTRAIVNTAARLGIRPDVLASVIAYETMGTMNPSIKGGKGSNYQGLIQFGPSERRTYGYKADESFADQVEGPVYRYLKDRGVQPGHGVAEVYSIINAGSLKNGKPRWNASDGNGTVRSHVRNIVSRIMPRMASMLEGAAPSAPNMEAIADVANYSQLDGGNMRQPEMAVASSPQTAATAIADLIDAPAGPPVDALAYNMGRVTPEIAGQGENETLVGGVSPPMPRARPDWLGGAGGPASIDDIPAAYRSRPRLPSGLHQGPDDLTGGSGLTINAMSPDIYRSRAEALPSGRQELYTVDDFGGNPMKYQLGRGDILPPPRASGLPAPPTRPEVNTGFPGRLDYISSGNVPPPRLRPVETRDQALSLVVGPPPRPTGALPAATPGLMPDAERQALLDDLAGLRAKVDSFSRETPEQAYDRMTREREQFNAEMDARAGTPVPKTDYFSPDFAFTAAPSEPNSFPPTQGAVKAPPLMEGPIRLPDTIPPMANAEGRFTDAFGPPTSTLEAQRRDVIANRPVLSNFGPAMRQTGSDILNGVSRFFTPQDTGLTDVADWLNAGGTQPAAATPAPLPAPTPQPLPPPVLPPKDQSRVPESNWFATQSYPPVSRPPVVDTVDPIRIGPSSSIDPTATDMMSSIGKPMGSVSAMPQYASTALTVPVPSPPPSISMSDFNSRFGGPPTNAVTSPAGWQPVEPTSPTEAPIDLRPPVAGGPPVTPAVTPPAPRKVAQPRQTNVGAQRQRQNTALRILGTVLGGPVGGILGGGGLFGGSTPFAQSSANAFQQTGSGQHPSGKTFSTGTIGSTNWDAGQYDNSKGQTVTYATDPWQGGYMVSVG